MSKILSVTDNSIGRVKDPVDLGRSLAENIVNIKDTIERFKVKIELPASTYRIISHKAYV